MDPINHQYLSDRLREAAERIDTLERALLDTQDKLEAATHFEAQRDTARQERDIYQSKLASLKQTVLNAVEAL